MDNTEFKKLLRLSMKERGFEYFQNSYYLYSEEIIIVIDSQKSNFDDSYYINFGFSVKALHVDLKYPKVCECDIRGRFRYESAGGIKDSYPLSTINAAELEKSLDKNVSDVIVPVINGGIDKYFELFPKAVCAITKKLRSYLNL